MIKVVLSAAWGLLGGVAEFFFLKRIVSAVTSRGKMNFMHIMAFMLLPIAILLPVAFIASDKILLCGSCAAGVLIISAVIHFLRNRNN